MEKMQILVLDLSEFFNSKYPKVPFDKLKSLGIGDEIIKEASIYTFKTSSKNSRNKICKILKRNSGNIKSYIDNKQYFQPENPKKINQVYLSLKKCAIDISSIGTVSCSSKHSPLSVLCLEMHMKNNFTNRYQLQKYIKRNVKDLKQKCMHNEIVLAQTSTPDKMNLKPLSFEFSPIENLALSFSTTTPTSSIEKEIPLYSNMIEKAKRNLNMLLSSSGINKSLSLNDTKAANVSIDDEELPDCIIKLDKKKSTFTGKVLPRNSRNICSSTWTRPAYSECKYLEGFFSVTDEEFKSMCEGTKLKSGRYQFIIKEKLKQVNNTCVINFKNSRYVSRNNSFKVYGYCAHICKKFIIVLQKKCSNDNRYCGYVYSSSLDFNHLGKVTRYLKGDERTLLRNKLKLRKPSAIRRIDVLNASPGALGRGNLQCVKSDAVYRKVRSEKLSLNDRDMDDIYDMCMMRRQNKSFIQVVGDPLHVYMYSKEQLEICMLEGSPILHLDATGSIVRKASTNDKRVFYYAGVIKTTNNNRVCPVLEMISCMHDAVSIGNWLAKFKLYCMQANNQWPIVSRVVVDFSFAFLNAISIFWNNMPLKVYLQETFSALINCKPMKPDVVKIHICCSHFFKVMANDVGKCFKIYDVKKTVKEVLATAFLINDIHSLKTWFKHFSVILTTPHANKQMNDALHTLVEQCCNLEELDPTQPEIDKPTDSIKVDATEESLYMSIPFYKFFLDNTLLTDQVVDDAK